jgi:hypothetical protein
MVALMLRAVLVLSVLAAGLHLPSNAHASSTVDVHQVGADCHDTDAPADDGTDTDGNAVHHHHHCPIAVTFSDPAAASTLFTRPGDLRPLKQAALASRATAPPLDPPLA